MATNKIQPTTAGIRHQNGAYPRNVTCYIKTTTQMTDTYPNPWDFHNTDKTLVSTDNYHRVVYYDLNEIAMGAPIGGQCFLETSDKKKVKIHDWCGGPPAWETGGQLLAIPIWTRKLLKELFNKSVF